MGRRDGLGSRRRWQRSRGGGIGGRSRWGWG